MKTKELRTLAQKIAKCEYTIQNSDNEKEIQRAQDEIIRLSSKVHDIQDIDIIDEIVQEILFTMS